MFTAKCPYCGEKMSHVITENDKRKNVSFGFACPNDKCMFFVEVFGIPYETYEDMFTDALKNDSFWTGVTLTAGLCDFD